MPNLSNLYCYHFSYIENLPSIIEHGLLSTNAKNALKIKHRDVASEGIQARRHEMQVTCEPGGKIHDYVPFYMCVRNPMFLALLNSKNIDQQGLLFFLIKMSSLQENNVVFTDASANTAIPPNFYNKLNDLEKLDWEAIQSQKWSTKGDKDELHRRMAEVLMKDKVLLKNIDRIVVFNESVKNDVIKIFKEKEVDPPAFDYSPVGLNPRYNFFYMKFMVIGKELETLITGPETLKRRYKSLQKVVKTERKKHPADKEFLFDNIEDCLKQVTINFKLIKELAGIHELKTDNAMHKDNVSDHTLSVVAALEKQKYYATLDDEDRDILKLAAYLHDIGKGPKTKWKDGIQKNYPDHPADGPVMLARILIEDFKELSDYEIRKISLLVIYHDLIGEIFGHGRNKQQLFDIVKEESDFDMLSALNLADVTVLNPGWTSNYRSQIEGLKEEVMELLDI
jgi:HD-GYP domain-containing protein (c-di-GMP phosphodiesterase class II)